MEPTASTPLTVALVNDYDIVVMGIAHILQQYQDRVVIAELDTNVAVSDTVDVVLSGAALGERQVGRCDDSDAVCRPPTGTTAGRRTVRR
ncbi:MAG TPA: hypothetical protein VFY56_12720 [Propionibacteriaceae bacterium]|nr:hypothetical protein [Propionibacteriaceae bacterium]